MKTLMLPVYHRGTRKGAKRKMLERRRKNRRCSVFGVAILHTASRTKFSHNHPTPMKSILGLAVSIRETSLSSAFITVCNVPISRLLYQTTIFATLVRHLLRRREFARLGDNRRGKLFTSMLSAVDVACSPPHSMANAYLATQLIDPQNHQRRCLLEVSTH